MKEKLLEENYNFFNRIAKYYDSHIFISFMNKIIKKMLVEINIKNNSKILDAGFGTGNLLKMLDEKNKNLELYGIDISEEMLKIARKKLNRKIKLELMSAEKINFEKDYFDYVFSTESFHHYYNQDLAMKKFYRTLKKGGNLIVLDFDFWIFNPIFHYFEPGNTKMNSAKDFKNLFKTNKFKDIKQKRIGKFTILTIGEK